MTYIYIGTYHGIDSGFTVEYNREARLVLRMSEGHWKILQRGKRIRESSEAKERREDVHNFLFSLWTIRTGEFEGGKTSSGQRYIK